MIHRSQNLPAFLAVCILLALGSLWQFGTADVQAQTSNVNQGNAGVPALSFSDSSLIVVEGGTNTYTVVLNTQPSANVTVTVNQPTNPDVTIYPESLTFTPDDWDQTQTVTVSAAEDDNDALHDAATVTHTVRGAVEYNSIPDPEVTVKVADNDLPPGVTISHAFLTITEGRNINYTVVLDAQPTADVTVTINQPAYTDVTTLPERLTFTAVNWYLPQTVTVSAAPDADALHGEATLSHTVSGAVEYNLITVNDVDVTVHDDDGTPGIVLSGTSVTVTEGSFGIYKVSLKAQPTANVTVTIHKDSSTSDVTTFPESLTFTADNWEQMQTVTVSAAHDADALHGSATLTHTAGGAVEYNLITANDVFVTVHDDDGIPGVTISDTSIIVTEGGNNTYTVVLDAQPTADVTVTINQPTNSDVTTLPESLIFKADNWDQPQPVTVSAAHDDDALHDVATQTHTIDASSADEYDSVTVHDVDVTVHDDDGIPGVDISDTSIIVAEDGNNTYTVVLEAQPTADVTVTIHDPSNTEVTVEPTDLTFTADDWYIPQTVTVSAVHDADALHDEAAVTHTVSGAVEYSSVTAENVDVIVHDDDGTPGITISDTSIIVTEGSSNTYTVVLEAQPIADVTVTIKDPTDNTAVTTEPTDLTFTFDNWDETQIVTVSAGQDADALHETATVTHTVGGAVEYSSVTAADVDVTVHDDDGIPGVTISDTSLTVSEGGSNTYTVVLDAQPTADVTVTINDPTEQDTTVTAEPTDLTFTADNWDQTQTVTVSAAEDDDDALHEEATVTHTIDASSADEYDSITVDDVGVMVHDDDGIPGVTLSDTSVTVAEGGSHTYTVVLDAQPTADVTVTINDPTDNSDVTTEPTDLTFKADNWDQTQTVTVSAAEDDIDALHEEATVTHTIAASSADEYGSVTVTDVDVTVHDNDGTPGVTISDTAVMVTEGGTNTYTVVLDAQPTADVTVTIVDPTDNSDVTTEPTDLTFKADNWDQPQTVTVSAAQDTAPQHADEDHETATVTHTIDASSADEYNSVTVTDVDVTVFDDELTPGVTITDTSIIVFEGGINTYTVVLDAQPTANVTVTINDPSDNSDVTIEQTDLTFTADNWDQPQAVAVSVGQDADALHETATVTHTVSGATEYNSVTADNVDVTVHDDDGTPGVTISDTTVIVTEGGSNTYTVVLDAQPTADVTVTIHSQSSSDVTTRPTDLTFTADDWDETQTVTVSAAHDTDELHEETYLYHTTDGANEYLYVYIADVDVTVHDDDGIPGVTISDTSLTVSEGGSNTYTVVLEAQPTADVTVTINQPTNTEVTTVPESLTFYDFDWDQPQTVVVWSDFDSDALHDEAIVTHTVSGAVEYSSVTAADVDVTVHDVDGTPGVTISDTSVTVAEGGSNTYTVVLDAQPTADVTVTIVDPTDNTEVTAEPTDLTFTADDWDQTQTVTVSAAHDVDALHDKATVTHTAGGADEYLYVYPADVDVTVHDDDGTPGITVSETNLTINEGRNTTYTVVLDAQPTAAVTVTINQPTNTEVTTFPESLTFYDFDWDQPQTVVVWSDYDSDALHDEAIVTHTVSGAVEYSSVTAADVVVTVHDVDGTPGVTISDTSVTVAEGGSNTYTVVLDAQPTADVTVTIVDPTDNTEVTAEPTDLTFTIDNWDQTQTVTVSAAHDVDALHDKATVTHTAGGADEYLYVYPADVDVTVHDDDGTPGVTISDTSVTVREGSTETYTVVLDAQPTADVTVTINQPTNTEVGVYPEDLIFRADDWDQPQTITVWTSYDSDALHDEATVTHAIDASSADEYDSVTVNDVDVTVHDADGIPGVTLSDTSVTVSEGGSNTYTVVLDAQPTADVTVTINDPTDNSDVTTEPPSLTFTLDNWDDTQPVTVSAAQDGDRLHETATVTHTVGGATEYTSVSAADVDVTVHDDDGTPGVTLSATSVTVDEGDDVTYTVVLDDQPTADVTVTIKDPTDNSDVTTEPTDLTFTFDNWDQPQTVTVFSAQDTASQDADEDHETATVTHTLSGAAEYTSVSISDVDVFVIDDEVSPGVTISDTSLIVAEGGSKTYTMVLDAPPSANVTVTIKDPTDNTDVTTEPTDLTFKADNWDQPQTVTVSAAQDTAPQDADEDHETATVTHALSGAAEYTSVSVSDVDVTVIDDEVPPGVTISDTSLIVAEGRSNTYTVVLDTPNSADVTVTINDPTDNTEVTAEPASLTFTTANWDDTQTVTVWSDYDSDALHDEATVTHTVSGAVEYTSVSADNVDVTVHDVDGTPGVTISDTLVTVPEDGSNTYTVVLEAQPTADVTVTIVDPTDNTDVTTEPTDLTFTFDNWDETQTVTVSAKPDEDYENDTATVIHTIDASSADEYDSVTVDSVTVTVTDDDVPTLNEEVQDPGELDQSVTTNRVSVDLDLSVTLPYVIYRYGELGPWHSLRGPKETIAEAYWEVEATGQESTTIDSQILWTDPDSQSSICSTTVPTETMKSYELEQTVELPADPADAEPGSWKLRLQVTFNGVEVGACNASPQVPATAVEESVLVDYPE